MSLDIRIDPTASPRPVPPDSNEDILDEWEQHMAGQASHTITRKLGTLRALARALPPGMLFMELRPEHLVQYLDQYHQRCRFVQFAGSDHEAFCRQKRDMAFCGRACPSWEAKSREVFGQHARAVTDFYSFLAHRRYIDANWTTDVVRQWARGIKWTSRDEEVGFRPAPDDVRSLIDNTPLRRSVVFATMAKCGLRIHEACKLRVKSVDLDEGWLEVPRGGKRQGNRWLPIDLELGRILQRWLAERDSRSPDHDALFTNYRGGALAPASASQQQLNRLWWQKDAVRLGLQEPKAGPEQRWHSHSMRHFFSDALSEAGCPDPWYGVLRGDRVRASGNRGRYTNTADRQRIRDYYRRYAPVLGFSIRA